MKKMIVYNDDGWSSYMRYPAPMSPEDVEKVTVGNVVDTGVGVYQFCALGGHAVNYNSTFLPRVGETMNRIDTLHVWRMRETLRNLEKLGADPLRIVSAACRRHGIACQFSLRMNDRHHTYRHADGSWYFPELQSHWLDEHPELLLPDRALDYAQDGVHEYRLRQIREILDRYEVDGIDLDFTRFKPFFHTGQEQAEAPRMTRLVREIRKMTQDAGKTLGARFEYDPQSCLSSGLEVEAWLKDGLLDQVTLGGVGDHTPSAPCDWWVGRAHATGAKVYPGMEGQLHWIASCGAGGTGIHPGRGAHDGFGPPSIEYMRAVASNHYESEADGVSLFNFTCADGPFDRAALTELADPAALVEKDKQYVAALWPPDAQIFGSRWKSRFSLEPGAPATTYSMRIADDIAAAVRRNLRPDTVLTLDIKGVNRLADIEVSINGEALAWNGYDYNHYDDGCWTDVVQFDVPACCLRKGENLIGLRRLAEAPGFDGAVEVRKCILDIHYPTGLAPGRVDSLDRKKERSK